MIPEIFAGWRGSTRPLAGGTWRWEHEPRTQPVADPASIAGQIRQAYSTRDVDALAPLLAEDVT
jgi:hypothetical protein